MRAAVIYDLDGHYGTIGNQAIWDRVKTYDLDRLFVDGRQLTKSVADFVLSRPCGLGARWSKAWYPNTDVREIAREMDATLTRAGIPAGASSRPCFVEWDYEDHNAPGFLAWLTEWRALRPTRATFWSLEPMQRGWWTAELVDAIKADPHLTVVGQTYTGDMQPVAQDAVWWNIASDIGPAKTMLAYDSRKGVPRSMNGQLFDLEHILL